MDLMRSLPLGLYLEKPTTWLHHLDSRVKLIWLLSFLVTPVLASTLWRLILAGILICFTLSALIPIRVWKQQMGWLLMFCFLVFAITTVAPDGLPVEHQPRLPPDELTFVQQPPELSPAPTPRRLNNFFGLFTPQSETLKAPAPSSTPFTLSQKSDYQYVLFKLGPIEITRRSFDLSLRLSTLLFTVFYSTTLYLLTTASEEITTGIENLMQPLRSFLPVTEIALTLTLSLRFIPLVLEEVQNLVRSVRTRAINWNKLGFRRATQVWLIVAERLLENLLLRSAQMANAMKVRGFTTPNEHQVQWYQLQLRFADWIAMISLIVLWSVRLIWGSEA